VTGTLRSVDPATGDEVASYAAFTPAEIEAAVAAAGIRELTNLRTWWVSNSATPRPGPALSE
jgi:acyl-CoA reductase-like NAD-dependent aldehyde dehydrogenase